MNSVFTYCYIFCLGFIFSQNNKENPTLKNFQKQYKYIKNKDYSGPRNDFGQPSELNQESAVPPTSYKPRGGKIEYSQDKIDRIREKRALEKNKKGNGGENPANPEMGKPRNIEFNPPDFNPPRVNPPTWNPFDFSSSNFSSNFWKILVLIIVSVLLLFLIYYILKNHRPKNKKVIGNFNVEAWNPLEITKTELELRLEKAIQNGDYRECVRIYFTFILKEMIRLNFIHWKKELTNFDYILQARSKKYFNDFEESVRIYDLVWYGNYAISGLEYKNLEQHLNKNYTKLNELNA